MFQSFVNDHFYGARRSSVLLAVAAASVAWLSIVSMATVFPQHARCSRFEAWAWAIVFAVSISFSLYSLLEVSFEDFHLQILTASLPLIAYLMFLFAYFDFVYLTGLSPLPDTAVAVMMGIAGPLTITLSGRLSEILLRGGFERVPETRSLIGLGIGKDGEAQRRRRAPLR